ncbi:MAG: anaerobic sulfatase maturase [Planctomycetes bacterium]|nr:anaerobic sulfatase maturase [Planctomycetota bacterium]
MAATGDKGVPVDTAGYPEDALREADKLYSILIKPVSWACNLKCTYCFYHITEALYEKPECMDVRTLERMVRDLQVLEHPSVAYGWQGGEPLVAGREFFHLAFRMQEKHRVGNQVIANAVQTNATLIDEGWARLFARNRVLLGVSLDGPKEIHDHYRGQGTHERVMKAIRLLNANRVEFNILAVLNDRNVKMGRRLYRYLVDHGFRWLQFIPIVEPGRDGGSAPFGITADEYADFLLDVFDEWRSHDMGRVSVRFFDSMVMHAGGGKGLLCLHDGACDAYVVVEHNGDVYPCDFFVRPEWKVGNLNDVPESDNAYIRMMESDVLKRFRTGRSIGACADCRYVGICSGGCQKDRLVRWKSFGGGLENRSILCPAYKKFYDATWNWFTEQAQRLQAGQPPAGSGGEDRG